MLGWIIFIVVAIIVVPLFVWSMKRAMRAPDTRKPDEWGDVSGADSSNWGSPD